MVLPCGVKSWRPKVEGVARFNEESARVYTRVVVEEGFPGGGIRKQDGENEGEETVREGRACQH